MKKVFCLALALLMLLPMIACSKQEEAPAADSTPALEGLHIGYAREKIMPDMAQEIPLAGYGNETHRLAQDYLDYLYITCVAFTEGDQTVLLMTHDQILTDADITNQIREGINAKTGIPKENILLSATHSHSTPALGFTDYPGIVAYRELMVEMGISAGMKALEDRAPSTMYGGYTTVDGLNFIRHYLMNDGTYYGSNFGSPNSGYKDHATDNDPTVGLLKVEREGDKDDILLMNFQAHPCNTGGIDKRSISADYVATTRNAVENQTGMLFAYFLGAAGNHNANSWMDSDRHHLDNEGYGQKLAKAAIDALPTLVKIEGSGIETSYQEFNYAMNKEDLDKLEQAKEVNELFKTTGNRDAGNALAYQYGLSSVYHASAIIGRSTYPETWHYPIHATRIGNFSFVNAPYEMFAASGKFIRDSSPFQTTFVISCSNDSEGYFPTLDAFEYGCYESFTCAYARGVAEDTADALVALLKGLQ